MSYCLDIYTEQKKKRPPKSTIFFLFKLQFFNFLILTRVSRNIMRITITSVIKMDITVIAQYYKKSTRGAWANSQKVSSECCHHGHAQQTDSCAWSLQGLWVFFNNWRCPDHLKVFFLLKGIKRDKTSISSFFNLFVLSP